MIEIRDDTKGHYKNWQDEREWNKGMGFTFAFILWPTIFAMDLSDKEKVEFQACEKRWNYLNELYANKECEFEIPTLVLVEPEPPDTRTANEKSDDIWNEIDSDAGHTTE